MSDFFPNPKVLGKTYGMYRENNNNNNNNIIIIIRLGAIYSISGIMGFINIPLNQVPVFNLKSFTYIHIIMCAVSVMISTFAIIFILR